MAVRVADKIKQLNDNNFALIDAEDVELSDGKRLDIKITELENSTGSAGKSAYELAVENGYTGTEEEWLESLEGMSAYEIAVKNGFTGTEEEYYYLTVSGINANSWGQF